MKKFIALSIAVLMILGPTATNAAKCKFQTDIASRDTGEKVRWTRWVRDKFYHKGNYGLLAAVSEGDQKYLAVQVVVGAGARYNSDIMGGVQVSLRPTKEALDAALVIPEGATLSITMADNTVYELVAENEVIGDSDFVTRGMDHYSVASYAVIKYLLDADAIAALSAQRAKGFKVQANGKEYAFSFGKKPVDKIQKIIACI
ncbi:MAG: hypothetical protein IIA05_11090 [Proteobacteria bacterium]|nr:hypothetical protein [Pseudomonadota bacterium]